MLLQLLITLRRLAVASTGASPVHHSSMLVTAVPPVPGQPRLPNINYCDCEL